MTVGSSNIYIPGKTATKATRLERFQQMNRFIMRRGGWIVSLPGADIMTIETLPDSSIPDELAKLGYDVEKIGDGERICFGAVTEIVDHGNAKRPPRVMHYDGPTRVERFSFRFYD
jgi:hypothetical protein